MKVARLYLRVSTDEQDLARQAEIEQSTLIRSDPQNCLFLLCSTMSYSYAQLLS
jgi:hypothetical protein